MFREFIERFRCYDSALVESLLHGYSICFESFSDSYNSVNDTVNYICSGNYRLNQIIDEHTHRHVIQLIYNTPLLGAITIDIIYGMPIDASTDVEMQVITIQYGDLFLKASTKNDVLIKQLLNTPELKSVLSHEIAHIVEYKCRESKQFKSQCKNIDMDRYNTDYSYHVNHKIERFPNVSQQLAYGISKSDASSTPHDIIKNVREYYRHNDLNYRNKQKSLHHIGKYLHDTHRVKK